MNNEITTLVGVISGSARCLVGQFNQTHAMKARQTPDDVEFITALELIIRWAQGEKNPEIEHNLRWRKQRRREKTRSANVR